MRYLICSVPRSGSVLLGRLLRDTKLVGNPAEWLSLSTAREESNEVSLFLERFNVDSYKIDNLNIGNSGVEVFDTPAELDSYLSCIEEVSSTNNIFGMKCHFNQFYYLARPWQDEARIEQFIRSFDKFILTSRKNKLEQAISLYKAMHTGEWMIEPGKTQKEFSSYDYAAINKAIIDLTVHETGWKLLLEKYNIDYLEVVYEDFIADKQSTLNKVFDHLGVQAPSDLPKDPIIKQGSTDNVSKFIEDYINEDFHRKYLNFFGKDLF